MQKSAKSTKRASEKSKKAAPKKTNSRAKGAVGERELAACLAEMGFPARRGQQFAGGGDSPDVVCAGLAGFHLECKRTERGSGAIYDWMAQATRDGGTKTPVVVHRQNGQDWVAIMRLEDLLNLILVTGITA